MKLLYDEVHRRFPEVVGDLSADEEDQPFTVMARIVEWLARIPASSITPPLVERLKQFARWCENQPRGETASEDLLTILVVGFYERLFQCDHLHHLLPSLIPSEEFVEKAAYLRDWVGAARYDQASKHFRTNA